MYLINLSFDRIAALRVLVDSEIIKMRDHELNQLNLGPRNRKSWIAPKQKYIKKKGNQEVE